MQDETPELNPIRALTRDLKVAAATLSDHEARFLVDAYYQMQEQRKRSNNQILALSKSGEPHVVLQWFSTQAEDLENSLKRALDSYSAASSVGRWSRRQVGIGPVIAAGLLAHIDIKIANTAGKIWRFAGLDASIKWHGSKASKELVERAQQAEDGPWEAIVWLSRALDIKPTTMLKIPPIDVEVAKELMHSVGEEPDPKVLWHSDNILMRASDPGVLYKRAYPGMKIKWDELAKALAKRPWNASLKTLCWKMGESFMKVSNKEDAFYGRIYRERKQQELDKNDRLEFREQAEETLRTKKIGKTTEAYKWLSKGQLPPAQILARSKRYAVKIFISHWHTVAYREHFKKEPPKPWIIEHGGHTDMIEIPEGRAEQSEE